MSVHRRIIDAIGQWDPNRDALRWPRDKFDALCAAVFAHQYTHQRTYRTFCERRGISPDDEPDATTIPAVATDAFKVLHLFAGQSPSQTFRTSGTTGGERGEHHFATLDVYRASLHPTFLRFCNPTESTLRLLVLAPSHADLPDSSLSFMLSELVDRHGDDGSAFFVSPDDELRWNIDVDGFAEALDQACFEAQPTMILGTAFAYAEVFERLDQSWTLPDGSRLMETGGFKGRFRDLSRPQLYDAFTTRLGVARHRCVSEYSMTELSSQTYSDHLVCGDEATGHFYAPPWLDIQIVDPVDLQPLGKPNSRGLIRFVDLANVDSVLAIQTSDRGILHPDGGLELLGRAPDAELRGCSLTIEEIVDAQST